MALSANATYPAKKHFRIYCHARSQSEREVAGKYIGKRKSSFDYLQTKWQKIICSPRLALRLRSSSGLPRGSRFPDDVRLFLCGSCRRLLHYCRSSSICSSPLLHSKVLILLFLNNFSDFQTGQSDMYHNFRYLCRLQYSTFFRIG